MNDVDNINSLGLMDELVEVDSNVDPEEFFNPPLADDGEHRVILALGNRAIKAQRQWEGKGAARKQTGPALLSVHLQLREAKAEGGEGGTVAFDQITTVAIDTNMGRTSRVHAVFALAGFPLTEKSLGGLKREIELALAQHPRVGIVTRWEAQVNDGTKEAAEYRTVLAGQKNFPVLLDKDGNETGRNDPEVTDPKSQQKCRAQVRVTKYTRTAFLRDPLRDQLFPPMR